MNSKDQEDYTYTVKRMDAQGHYEVTKWGDGAEPEDQYTVFIPLPNSTKMLWCGCQGFRRQKYAQEKHKHIVLVRTFIKQNEPTGRVYRLSGPPAEIDIIVVRESLFTMDPKAFDPSN